MTKNVYIECAQCVPHAHTLHKDVVWRENGGEKYLTGSNAFVRVDRMHVTQQQQPPSKKKICKKSQKRALAENRSRCKSSSAHKLGSPLRCGKTQSEKVCGEDLNPPHCSACGFHLSRFKPHKAEY